MFRITAPVAILRRLPTPGCLLLGGLLALPGSLAAQQPSVNVQPPNVHGSRSVEALTAKSVVRDYLQSWRALHQAFLQNNPSLLDRDFVGTALTQLGDTIAQQKKLGLTTRYQDTSHNLQIVFYSPDGLSIQLIDRVDYDQQILQNGNVLASRPMHARYIVVMTPSQTSWQVRFFQATKE